jgi:hypothetical protein
MRRVLILALALAPFGLLAQEVASTDPLALETKGSAAEPFLGSEVTLEQFRWIARPVVVFADTDADPAFRRQMELLAERPEALAERDVVVIVDTDPARQSAVREALRPRGFMLAVMDKDGQVELRKPSPWDVREITRTIDKMPLRQQEIRDALRGE